MTLLELPEQTEVGNNFIANYPPFSLWSAEAAATFEEQLRERPVADRVGIYLHLPFCAQRCAYCYFRVHVKSPPATIDRYLAAVVREAALYAQQPALAGRNVACIYLGGGTPSYLSLQQSERLFGGLRAVFSFDQLEEFTVECNPESLTPEKLTLLRDHGVSRISLGFQSLSDHVLRRSGRAKYAAQSIRAFHAARDAGFDQINVDLLAGLPGETEESWRKTTDHIVALAPDCVTVYQMELTYNSSFYAAIRRGSQLALPSWPAKREWVRRTFEYLEEAGYRVISSYMALRGDARWRFVYTEDFLWKGGELVGLGESSFGHLQGTHYQNCDGLEGYMSAVERGTLPLWRALRPTCEERLRRECILLLRLGTLDFSYFQDKFGVDIVARFGPLFEQLVDHGFAQITDQQLTLTRPGLLAAEWLMPLFYLPEHRGVRYT